jgi:excisionase family DNA binding protein
MQTAPFLDIGGMDRKTDAPPIRPIQTALKFGNSYVRTKSAAPSFYTERSLAAYLAVSDRTIRNWIRRGELPRYKLGAARRIDPADVEDFLARHRDEAA